MIQDASVADNINNFTIAGKEAKKSELDKSQTALFSNYQDFVKLLTVQLENQDPTKPLETDQITSQVAQLSTVEQQINTNRNLEKLMAAFDQSQTSTMVSYIGTYVEGPGNLSALQGGQATFLYNLAADAKEVKLTITDPQGKVVFNADGTKLAGRNTFRWDGKNNAGVQMPDGTYKVEVQAKDDLGKVVKSTTSSFGRVTAIEAVDGDRYLAMGDILVPLDKAVSIRA